MRLSVQASRAYRRTLMANVVALIGDAHVLMDHDSPGRARSLLILAQEELARAAVLYNSAVPAWEGRAKIVELSGRRAPMDPGKGPQHLTVSNNHEDELAADYEARRRFDADPPDSGWPPNRCGSGQPTCATSWQ